MYVCVFLYTVNGLYCFSQTLITSVTLFSLSLFFISASHTLFVILSFIVTSCDLKFSNTIKDHLTKGTKRRDRACLESLLLRFAVEKSLSLITGKAKLDWTSSSTRIVAVIS